MVAGGRLALVIALTACGSGPSVQTQYFSNISNVHDPEILADLSSIAAAPARQSKGGEDRDTAAGALASCMIAVGNYVPPSDFALAAFDRNYVNQPGAAGCLVTDYDNAAFAQTCVRPDRSVVDSHACAGALVPGCLLSQNADDTLSVASWATPCGLPCAFDGVTMPPSLAAMAGKYQARCSAERETEVAAELDVEIGEDVVATQRRRDDNLASFGDAVIEIDRSIDSLSKLAASRSMVQKDRDAAVALRYRVYGSKAMESLIALEPDVVRANKELDAAERELGPLRQATTSSAVTATDVARVRELQQGEVASHATIDAVRARYGYADIVAREQAYTSDPEVAQATRRLAEVNGMLATLEPGGIPPTCGVVIDPSDHTAVDTWIAACARPLSERRATDPQRITELLGERHALSAQLGALRERHDVHWPM